MAISYASFNWEDLSHTHLHQNDLPQDNVNLNLELQPKLSSPIANRYLNLKIQHNKNSPITKDDFHLMLDVHHFKSEEIEVKVVNDDIIIIAEHEEKQDSQGWVSRSFVRRVKLPKDVNVDCLTCRLCTGSLLMIVAPKMKDKTFLKRRTLPIKYTGKPFRNKN